MLQQVDGGSTFMPHGMCYLWEPELLWLHVISDVATALAYWAIPPMLVLLVVRARREVPEGADYGSKRLPHEWMFLMFGLFIVACGTTHLFAAWNVWNADYWLSGGVKAVTALASVATAIALPPLIPRALKLVRDARESELHRSRLEVANEELAALNERLQQMHEQKTRFFANISHELRTPLTLILGPLEARLEGAADPDLKEDLELVRSNARILERRVKDLLDLAGTEAGQESAYPVPVDVAALVEDTRLRFRAAAAERGIDFRVEAGVGPVVTDPDKLERVVDNLVTNAFKFTPRGGALAIRVRAEPTAGAAGEADGAVILEVADSGPGIPAEERERVFERFLQLGGAGAGGMAGSGLGLAIVRDFVHLLGGTVAVDDDPELGGARFTVRLPASGPDASRPLEDRPWQAPARPAAGAEPGEDGEELAPSVQFPDAAGPGAPGAGRRAPAGNAEGAPRVLVVEDLPDMRHFLDRTLRAGHEVRVASGGEDALRILDGWSPDLVLTDLMMPGMDGETLVARIRDRPGLENVPILVLSARADDGMRTRLLRGGAQDYVTKPFSGEELRARVRNLVSMKRVRDLLRSELQSATGDIHALAVELRQRHGELEQALREVREARDVAESASRAKSEFLAVMSHELRTPLNGIIGYAELLREGVAGEVSPEQVRHLDRIRAGAGQLVSVIDDILVFSREGSQPRPVERAWIDVEALVDEVVEGLRPRADVRGLRLTTTVPAGIEIHSDRERLRRILTNLVANAVKFTPEGEVGVDVRTEDDAIVFQVRDTGIGIDPEDRDRIFDPFWQVDQSSTRTEGGTGLGLSIVQRLVTQLGGGIEIDSRPGEGSTFTVRLPGGTVPRETETEGQRETT